MRPFITLVESMISEIERGGAVDGFPGDVDQLDLSSDQLDLFKPNKTTGEPHVPPGTKLVGRCGEFYVAHEPHEPDNAYGGKKTDNHTFYFILDGKVVAYIYVYNWVLSNLNYQWEVAHEPMELHGRGFRVGSVFVAPEQRRKGIGLMMYKWLLENFCDYLMADAMHTTEGAILWKKLQSRSPFVVHVWDNDKYLHRRRWRGKDFNQVYNSGHLIPWVTLQSKEAMVLGGEEAD